MLRIAFDLDGVLADMDGELARHSETLFGAERAATAPEPPADGDDAANAVESPADATTIARLRVSARQERRLWQHVQAIENFWETLAEIEPGAVARLALLASERRWEIIFLTKRPHSAGATAQVQTQRWLEAKGFPRPSVFVVQGSRGRIASALALDFVVDDRPENCLDVVVDSSARALLVWRNGEDQLPAAARRLGVVVVKSVANCLAILAQADGPPPESSGLVSRVKRALGLKEPAGA